MPLASRTARHGGVADAVVSVEVGAISLGWISMSSQSVTTSGLMYCMMSQIAIPGVHQAAGRADVASRLLFPFDEELDVHRQLAALLEHRGDRLDVRRRL